MYAITSDGKKKMSYQEAIEAAGVKVLAFESFGSYQGDWFAKVDGGYVWGTYGSCTGCDAFEAEFGWGDPTIEALAEFGKGYTDDIWSAEKIVKVFTEQMSWDLDARSIVEWINKQEGVR